jgi:hypothetical protein
MVRGRPAKNRPTSRASILQERRKNNARREREVVREAIRLRRFTPSQTIEMMMELSDLCVRIGRGRKDV